MYENGKIYMGLADGQRVELALNMCNRHGLIAGASGTGKTITMKVMAESFSDAGVPVFLCDVKGDVAGICAPGVNSEGLLGYLSGGRPRRPRYRQRHGAGASQPHSGADSGAGGDPAHRVPHC